MSESKLSRRNFLRLSALGAAGTVLLPRLLDSDSAVAAPAKGKTAASDTVRLGFIGLGQQAMYLLNGFLTIDGVRIVAGADVYGIKRERFDRRVRKYYASKGIKPEVKTYENYQDILARPDIDAVVIATGGLSYPSTGSTGDGYRFAKEAGHTVTPLSPALVPFVCAEDDVKELQGLSLRNIEVTVWNGKKLLWKEFGEMLFTHFGVSGPVILSASRHIILTIEEGYRLYIDLKPAMDEKKLDARILRDFEKFANKDFANALDALLPQKLIPVIIRLSGIDARKKVNSVTKEERKRLVGLLKELPLTITGTTGYNEAVVTCGGIQVNEIDPATMESKFVKQLHFAGEVLDVDAYTGGFNLQIAFSTGFAAGNAVCAE